MALPQYIYRRGNRLSYRRAFPKDLWPETGKVPFTLALGTDSLSEAMRARPEAERRYWQAVDAARARLRGAPLTRADAERLALDWFREAVARADELRTASGPEGVAKALDDAEWIVAEERRALAEGDLADTKRLARCLRERAGLTAEPAAEASLVRLLGRAAVALAEVERGRIVADYGRRPTDPLFAAAMEVRLEAPAASPAPAAPKVTIADLEREYRTAKFPGLSDATKLGYEPVFRLLKETLGPDTRLDAVTHADGQRLFQAVQSLPANAQKKAALEGLSVLESIEAGKRLGLPTLSAKTVNDSYMANLGAVFRFAQGRGWIAANPVTGLRVKDRVNNKDRRDPFGPRLSAVFGAPPWTPKDASEPLLYWAPLLALFHGLRLAEVAGLLLRDVAEEAGTPMLHVREGPRTLKSKAARRDLPVHPELVRLGFLEFVRERREGAGAEAVLFEGQQPNGRGKWGRRLSERFSARVKASGVEGRKLTFHSLRHDFKDALREAEVAPDVAAYLMGHAEAGMAGVYGGRPSLARLLDAMGRVRFQGLAL